jgi:hypothetical protein
MDANMPKYPVARTTFWDRTGSTSWTAWTTPPLFGNWVQPNPATTVDYRVDKWFTPWGCLQQIFRHACVRHATTQMFFRAVAIITQLCINSGESIFNVEYDDYFTFVPPFPSV